MNPYTKLAKESIKYYLENHEVMPVPPNLPKSFYETREGVFVTLYKKNKELRGCIGTFLPTQESLAREIVENAVSAATMDPRFLPVDPEELANLRLEISILNAPEKIESEKQLDAKKYGVIVRTSDGRSGLLLPNIEGVKTPLEQIEIAASKGGINLTSDKVELLRFKTQIHADEN